MSPTLPHHIAVTRATPREIPLIRDIAQKTWPSAYSEIISAEQIQYMLHKMYDSELLRKEMENPDIHYFLINKNQGFASVQTNYDDHRRLAKIHKIYILPRHQKKGLGRKTIEYLARWADLKNQKGLILNVNKNNNAVQFYKKMGFIHWKSETIDIGQGFVMDDYILKKKI